MLGCIDLILLCHRLRHGAIFAGEESAVSLFNQHSSILISKRVNQSYIFHENDGVMGITFDEVSSILHTLHHFFSRIHDCVRYFLRCLVRQLSVQDGALDAIDILVRVVVKLNIGWMRLVR